MHFHLLLSWVLRMYKSLFVGLSICPTFAFSAFLTPCPFFKGGGKGAYCPLQVVQLHLDEPDTRVWQLVFFIFSFSMIRKSPKTTHRRKKSFAHSYAYSAELHSVPMCCTPLCSALLHGAHNFVHKCNSVYALKRPTCVIHKRGSHESILDRFEP